MSKEWAPGHRPPPMAIWLSRYLTRSTPSPSRSPTRLDNTAHEAEKASTKPEPVNACMNPYLHTLHRPPNLTAAMHHAALSVPLPRLHQRTLASGNARMKDPIPAHRETVGAPAACTSLHDVHRAWAVGAARLSTSAGVTNRITPVLPRPSRCCATSWHKRLGLSVPVSRRKTRRRCVGSLGTHVPSSPSTHSPLAIEGTAVAKYCMVPEPAP